MDLLEDKATGALAGAAIGDALGGAAEGNTPEAIQERYNGFITGIVPPFLPDWKNARPISPYHKGDGHITDDTLMTNVLVEVYDKLRHRLDAFDIAEHLVPLLSSEKRWIPELETESLLLHRIFLAEKWLVTRLQYGHIDPREAGVGNIVNCGATMYVAPIGIVNAGSAAEAYAEAIDVAGAHQSSYGREAAGVYAATVAEAMRVGSSVDQVIAVALRLAKDGTRDAIEAVVDAAASVTDWRSGLATLRAAVVPFDTVGPNYRAPARDARIPSRTKSIEELPIALGMLVAAQGDYSEAVLGSINYGRDSDSIAVMAGSIAGALGGTASLPREWIAGVNEGSRMDVTATGPTMAAVARDIWAADQRRFDDRAASMSALAGAAASAVTPALAGSK
ncbi:ADP-ribosylglycohydrolase family protein [Leifsonia kafniensis]|uniref:ADP-ribosylglycohydrolase family protein n=1 Tax=Leifsonia kafniensis TaxID=475957 RepID=A0ABP7KJT3_9MICO